MALLFELLVQELQIQWNRTIIPGKW